MTMPDDALNEVARLADEILERAVALKAYLDAEKKVGRSDGEDRS
jgi:hypothetical protein